MQLSQPIHGSHPGRSGLSALEHLLEGAATVPPERGILLSKTRRQSVELASSRLQAAASDLAAVAGREQHEGFDIARVHRLAGAGMDVLGAVVLGSGFNAIALLRDAAASSSSCCPSRSAADSAFPALRSPAASPWGALSRSTAS